MAKRKAESSSLSNGSKKAKHNDESIPKVSKPIQPGNLLDDSDSSEDESAGGVELDGGFKINEEYAKRFEHNKKREELQRLEEKYEKPVQPVKGQYGDKYDEDSDSSSEDEDDDGFLATEDLDAEISATLQAIRSKDPRVYDEKVTFYKPIEEDADKDTDNADVKKEKPMYLQDYHRENLLKGYTGAEEEAEAPRTFAQEQEDLKKTIVKEIHAAADGEAESGEDEDEDDGFLVRKSKPEASKPTMHPSRAARVEVDVTVADKDPETFLSNFMAARAWVPSGGARFQPLESDDEEEDTRAESFETAYNLRFEDPTKSNELLKSYARDVVAAKSVRRDEPNSRKKQRDAQREKKDAEKRERDEERAQLRRLKIEEMEEKLQKVKKAAGLRGKTLKDEDWTNFLDDGWDDSKWEEEMNKRFGEEYYAEEDVASDSDDETEDAKKKKKKVKKPKWDDDIDIKDLVPEFNDEEAVEKPAFTLSDSEDDEADEDEDGEGESTTKSKTKKDRQQEKAAKKKAARIERKKIEELVDNKLDFDDTILPGKSSKQPSRFRYRETSPTSFGLTARDILMAPDASLNQFAGLKKMAAFRDVEKKRKDKKYLGKKARLREWRKDTFGNEDGPEIIIGTNAADSTEANEDGVDVIEGKKKKKRSRKSKSSAAI
ncbi:hypothetical protein BP5796_04759 [Coleophoma crateriformis]|uniref:Kri1-like C-terminal domain-containing protein n=1 Tax=Coleophoma crateriformis TaxID=565419 RepID=A0A3D8SBY3_9HELO|nr:hypothetical protein BP5796_04759 [Coleophoma crateriformis]